MSKQETNEKQPIVVCRPLFYTVLKYIYLVVLGLMLVTITINILFNSSYSFIMAVISLIGSLIVFFGFYLLCNWIYNCVLKTMLALTDKELHFEFYRPFIKLDSTILLSSVKKVSTVNYFWIFRFIIIHQYHKLPMIFPTWNNEEMKDEINKIIIKEDKHVLNDYESGSLIPKDKYKKVLSIIGIVLGALLLISAVTHIVRSVSRNKLVGTYKNGSITLELSSDATCQYDDSTSCKWSSYKKDGKYYVDVDYEYSFYYYDGDASFTAELDTKNNTFTKTN